MGTYFGDGGDGSLTVTSGSFNLNTDTSGSRSYADGIAYKVTNDPITTGISIGTSPNGIVAGDKVMLINLGASSGDYEDVGNWEVFDVESVGANSISIDRTPSKSYDGSVWSNQNVVVQRIPQYSSVDVSEPGTITASAYDRLSTTPAGSAGYYTGVVALMVSNNLYNYGFITASELGYNGAPATGGSGGWGYGGEGTGAPNTSIDGSVNDNPEGGAGESYYPGTGGAGGGHGTDGENGNPNNDVSGTIPQGGISFGDAPLSRMNYGGGGGGGGPWTDSRSSVAGGNGGGIVYIEARNIYSYGLISADGQDGADGVKDGDLNSGGAGGGGAGGTVYIRVYSLIGNISSITAVKGSGGNRDAAASKSKDGGDGGAGLTRIDYSYADGDGYPATAAVNSIIDPDPYESFLDVIVYYFTGYVYAEDTSSPVSRTVRIYNRYTGDLLGSTTSSGNGYYYIETTYSGTHYLLALDDSYNLAALDRMVPATSSG